MSFSRSERETKKYYDLNANSWSEKHNTHKFWGDYFDKFAEGLKGKRVLDVGCGPARDGETLCNEYSLEYVGIDYSMSMLKIADNKGIDGDFVQASYYDLPFCDASFDGFWASSTLLHATDIKRALKEIARVTKKGGRGFVTLVPGEGEKIDDNGRFFRYYGEEEFRKIADVCSLSVKEVGIRALGNLKWRMFLVEVL